MKPRLYDKDMNFLCVLQNATSISYTKKYNDLYTASFELPAEDPKVQLCGTQCIVDIFDADECIGKFRIIDEPEVEISAQAPYIKFSCEHVIAFLLNDVIDGYLKAGSANKDTAGVIEKLLSFQTTQRWRLGKCEAQGYYKYTWENTNICDALFSVTGCFDQDYRWTYDTDSYPWTVNLLAMPTQPSCLITRGKNMTSIKRTIDASQLCTRLYCKGYGQGVNQLTIKDVNNGLPYIDADTISKYGIMCSHYIDTTITEAETLLAKGKRLLETYKQPKYTYTAKAIDLYRITGNSIDYFDEGTYVHILDSQRGVNVDAKIIEVTKNDVDGNPLDVDITISTKDTDTSDAISDLAKRTAETAQYSQGATNLYCQQFADNADEDNGAVIKFYVPSSCVRINQVLLSFEMSAFRAYSKSAKASGATGTTSSSGGSGTFTSSSGGGSTQTITLNPSATVTLTAPVKSDDPETSIRNTGKAGSHSHTVSGSSTDTVEDHIHTMIHKHNAECVVTIPSTSIKIPAHTHEVPIDAHTHEFTLPAHSHKIEYGIYKGTTATQCDLKVDGTVVSSGVAPGNDIEIVEYLSKDSNGKVKRDAWHTIEIVPNRLTRIEASLFVQTFVTSYSGGDY